jgi:D-aspartate ligase
MVNIEPSIPVFTLVGHHGTLGIARSLGRLGIEVYGIDRDVTQPAFRSRYFADAFEWDLDSRPAQESVEFLGERAKVTGQRPLLIPTSDETALFVAQNAIALSESFVFACQDATLIEKLVSKRDNYELAKAAGIPVPDTVFPQSARDVKEFAENTAYPVMVKGISGAKLLERAGRKMAFAHSKLELLALYDLMEDPEDPNIMLQEYIPGGDDTIWMFDGYFDQSSKCRFGITGRKLRQTPPHMGSTSLGICEHNETVFQLTTDFMSAIAYTGILDIGFRYDARDGQYKLLDPNPRIGSTFRLFVGSNGMDTARYLYMDVTRQQLPESQPREGRKWVVEGADLHAFSIYRQEGTLSLWQWLRSFRGVEEAAWFASDDLKPILPVFGGIAAHSIRYLWRGLRRMVGLSDG